MKRIILLTAILTVLVTMNSCTKTEIEYVDRVVTDTDTVYINKTDTVTITITDTVRIIDTDTVSVSLMEKKLSDFFKEFKDNGYTYSYIHFKYWIRDKLKDKNIDGMIIYSANKIPDGRYSLRNRYSNYIYSEAPIFEVCFVRNSSYYMNIYLTGYYYYMLNYNKSGNLYSVIDDIGFTANYSIMIYNKFQCYISREELENLDYNSL